jgi:hypothetical protein
MRETSSFWNAVFTAAAGVIPASLAALFIMALPIILRALSRFQGALSRGQLDKDVIRQMFVFLLVSSGFATVILEPSFREEPDARPYWKQLTPP